MPENAFNQSAEVWQKCMLGDGTALRPLISVLYKELRRLAQYHIQSERPDHTLQGTALVHEVYLRLAEGRPVALESRTRFMAAASRLMRQILVDYARARRAHKRDWGRRVDTTQLAALPANDDAELLALNDALDELSSIDERQGKIVEMKFFAGLPAAEIGQTLGISRATVDREWATARVWLHRRMSKAA